MRKLTEINDQEYMTFNESNRKIVEKFLKNRQAQLSPQTLKQYTSGLRHFLRWIHEEIGEDKEITSLKPRHGEEYITYLASAGLSSAGVRFKVASASSLCKFIIRNYDDEYPRFKNIFDGAEKPPKGDVREKKPLAPEEYKLLLDTLEERGEWEMIAYVKFTYATGCRRAEARQLLKEIVGYSKVRHPKTGIEKPYYNTHNIRCKGRGKQGKVRKLIFDDEAMDAIKKWIDVRGEDDCPYVFVVKTKAGKVSQVSETTFNYWCKEIFSKIVGRRVHPHQFREQRATDLVVIYGKDIKAAQALLGHESSQTTEIYVIRENDDSIDDAF